MKTGTGADSRPKSATMFEQSSSSKFPLTEPPNWQKHNPSQSRNRDLSMQPSTDDALRIDQRNTGQQHEYSNRRSPPFELRQSSSSEEEDNVKISSQNFSPVYTNPDVPAGSRFGTVVQKADTFSQQPAGKFQSRQSLITSFLTSSKLRLKPSTNHIFRVVLHVIKSIFFQKSRHMHSVTSAAWIGCTHSDANVRYNVGVCCTGNLLSP